MILSNLKNIIENKHPEYLDDVNAMTKLQSLYQQEWPNSKIEEFKYTSLQKMAAKNFVGFTAPSNQFKLDTDLESFLEENCSGQIVFVNGELHTQLTKLPIGASLSLSRAPKFDEHKIAHADYNAFDFFSHDFSSLLSSQRLELRLEAVNSPQTNSEDVTSKKVLAILNIQFSAERMVEQSSETNSVSHDSELKCSSHCIDIIVEDSAHYQILEYSAHVGTDYRALKFESNTNALASLQLNVELKSNSKLEYYILQNGSHKQFFISNRNFSLQQNSHLKKYQIDLGTAITRNHLKVDLNESEAFADLKALYLAHDKSHIDNFSEVHHHVCKTISEQFYQGILADHSRGVFRGQVVIHPMASESTAKQLNQNILLSDQVEVDTQPRLEIHNDNVKANHGATSGQLDPEHLFYLLTRGIEKDKALQLILNGQALKIISDIPDSIKNFLSSYIQQRLMYLQIKDQTK